MAEGTRGAVGSQDKVSKVGVEKLVGFCTDSVKHWLRRYEVLCRGLGVEPEKAIFHYVDETIFDSLSLTFREDLAKVPWKDLREHLLTTFDCPADKGDVIRQLQARRQKAGEVVGKYAHDISRMCAEIEDNPDKWIDHFVAGLHEDIAMLLGIRSWKTFAEAANDVRVAEKRLRSLRGHKSQASVAAVGTRFSRGGPGPSGGQDNPHARLTCYYCREKGHIRANCPKRKRNHGGGGGHYQRGAVRALEADDPEDDGYRPVDMDDFAGSKPMLAVEPTAYVDIVINGRPVSAVVDTGAMVSVLSASAYRKDVDGDLGRTSLRLHGAGGNALKVDGAVSADLCFGDSLRRQHTLPVVDCLGYDCLLGADLLSALKAQVDFHQRRLVLGKVSLPLLQRQGINAVVPQMGDGKDEEGAIELTGEQRSRLNSLLARYSKAFSSPERPLGNAKVPPLTIDTGDAPPVSARPYRLSAAERDLVDKEVEALLAKGVIRPSLSPWASPCILVKRKDASPRLCVDFRKVNVAILPDAYPMPRLDDCIDSMGGCRFLSTLDLASAYHQCPVDAESVAKTAFVTRNGLYEYTKVPFGIRTAPGYFQRTIDRVLNGIKGIVVFLDDICVATPTFDEHLQVLEQVFKRLLEIDLLIKPSKCHLLRRSLGFLGHRISERGIEPDPAKLEAVDAVRPPRSVEEVRQFLGLTGFYRRFVEHFADIARPLTQLLKKDEAFVWGQSQQQAFVKLKQQLKTSPVLRFPDFTRPFTVTTDASGTGIGCVLSQPDDEGRDHPVAYASRTLSPAETRYTVTEQELLGVVWALKKFRPYIYGKPCTVITDHRALQWLQSLKNPAGRLGRWALACQDMDFKVVHRPGCQNAAADALSRLLPIAVGDRDPLLDGDDDDDGLVAPGGHGAADEGIVPGPDAVAAPGVDEAAMGGGEVDLSDLLGDFEEHQADDRFCLAVRAVLDGDEPDCEGLSWTADRFVREQDKFSVAENGLLCRCDGDGAKVLVVVPRAARDKVIAVCHDHVWAGHLGPVRTLKRAQQHVWWPSMRRDIEAYIKRCEPCSKRQGYESNKGLPMGVVPAAKPLDVVAMDVLGPLPESDGSNRYLLVISDYFTRFVVAVPMPDQQARTVATVFLGHFVMQLGIPNKLLTDQGSNFRSNLMRDVLALLKVRKLWTTPYHPACDGMVERWNRTVCDMLSKYCDVQQRDWDQYVGLMVHAYNSSYHPTVGHMPYYLMYGREPSSVLEHLHRLGPVPGDEAGTITRYARDMALGLEEGYERHNIDTRKLFT